MDRLPRPVPTIKPAGTIASVENYKRYYSLAVMREAYRSSAQYSQAIKVTVLLLVGDE
jgi:hypothetical protein